MRWEDYEKEIRDAKWQTGRYSVDARDSIWRRIAERAGFDLSQSNSLRMIFDKELADIEGRYLKQLRELQEKADISERQVELLQKEIDTLYEKYVEEKATRLLNEYKNPIRGNSEPPQENGNETER